MQTTERTPSATSPQYSHSPLDSPYKSLPIAPASAERTTRSPKEYQHTVYGSQYVNRQSSTDELQKALKANARSKMQRTSSRDIARTPSQSNINKSSSTEESLNSLKPLSRKVSFSERTRSLTRKFPFMKDFEDVRTTNDLRAEHRSTDRHLSPESGIRTPMSNTQSPRSPQSERSVSGTAGGSTARSSQRSFEPHLVNSRGSTSPSNRNAHLSTSTRSNSAGSGSIQRLNSIMARPKVVTISSSSSGTGSPSHPVLKSIQAREVRFCNTAPDSPVKSAPKDLPLRHYKSYESLPAIDGQDTIDSMITSLAARPTSARDSSSTKNASARGSLGGVLEDKSSTTAPVSGLHSREPSSIQQQDSETPAQLPPTSAELAGNQTQASSVYSPDGPISTPYSFSLSPYTTLLSPVPAQSSAAPSPLRVAAKAPFERVAPTSEAPMASVEEQKTAPKDPASEAPIAITEEQASVPNDPAYIPISTIPMTAYTSTIVPGNTPPRSPSPLEVLTSATVSGPEPDINPYDISRSDATTPLSTKITSTAAPAAEKVPVHQARPVTPLSRPTFSPFPSPRPLTASSRSQTLHNGFASPPLSTPGTLAIVSTHAYTNNDALATDKGSRSPWKKVFGHGIGKSIGSMGRGHKKNRSDAGTGSEPPMMASEAKKGRAGDDGFMGAGKEGVWISRKNFLRT